MQCILRALVEESVADRNGVKAGRQLVPRIWSRAGVTARCLLRLDMASSEKHNFT